MMGPGRISGRAPGGQSYQEQPPVRALEAVVASVWVQQIAPSAVASYPHRSVPNGSVELRCRVGAGVQLAGPLTQPRIELLPPGTTVVGVRFRAGAAAGVLGVRPSELADITVDAGELWGRDAADLGARVAGSGSAEAAGLLEQAIIDRLGDAAGPDPLVAEAVRRMVAGHPEDVGELRSSLFLSERQFRRRCEAATGLAPKALQRVLRFQGVLGRVQFALARGQRPTAAGLGRLAAAAGYADQSHLARECRRLTGLSPRAFLGQTEEQCGPSHDHRASFAPLLSAGWPV
jgi:AraC-like DNA-binding protein